MSSPNASPCSRLSSLYKEKEMSWDEQKAITGNRNKNKEPLRMKTLAKVGLAAKAQCLDEQISTTGYGETFPSLEETFRSRRGETKLVMNKWARPMPSASATIGNSHEDKEPMSRKAEAEARRFVEERFPWLRSQSKSGFEEFMKILQEPIGCKCGDCPTCMDMELNETLDIESKKRQLHIKEIRDGDDEHFEAFDEFPTLGVYLMSCKELRRKSPKFEEMLHNFANAALNDFNSKHSKEAPYMLKAVTIANRSLAAGYLYYITFLAERPIDSSPKEFQAALFHEVPLDKPPSIHLCRLKPLLPT